MGELSAFKQDSQSLTAEGRAMRPRAQLSILKGVGEQ